MLTYEQEIMVIVVSHSAAHMLCMRSLAEGLRARSTPEWIAEGATERAAKK